MIWTCANCKADIPSGGLFDVHLGVRFCTFACSDAFEALIEVEVPDEEDVTTEIDVPESMLEVVEGGLR